MDLRQNVQDAPGSCFLFFAAFEKQTSRCWRKLERTRVRSGITLHVIGNEAGEQVAVKGEKEFLEVQH